MTNFVEYFPSCFVTKNVVSFPGSFCHRKLMESEEGDLIYPRISCPRSDKKDKQRIKIVTNTLMSEINFYKTASPIGYEAIYSIPQITIYPIPHFVIIRKGQFVFFYQIISPSEFENESNLTY